jgi:hypothetical protein
MTRDAEPMRKGIDSISNAELVIGTSEVVVFIATRDEKVFLESKPKVMAQARAFDLELMEEGYGSIDETCVVRVERRDAAITPMVHAD